jgi:hypothetical protein
VDIRFGLMFDFFCTIECILLPPLRHGRDSHGVVAARSVAESTVVRRRFGVFARFKASEPYIDLLGGRMEAVCLILDPSGQGVVAELFADFLLLHFGPLSVGIVFSELPIDGFPPAFAGVNPSYKFPIAARAACSNIDAATP